MAQAQPKSRTIVSQFDLRSLAQSGCRSASEWLIAPGNRGASPMQATGQSNERKRCAAPTFRLEAASVSLRCEVHR